MFSSLSKGSVLYGLDTKGEVKLFTATVDTVSMPRPRFMQNTFGQLPETVVDISATINGERREFKQVPSNNAIADFGPESIILADNSDSLFNYVNSLLLTSENIVNSADKHKELIPQYKKVLSELKPGTANDEVVTQLKEEVGSLKSQLAEAISLLKERTSKTE
jgi:hypothetical protein